MSAEAPLDPDLDHLLIGAVAAARAASVPVMQRFRRKQTVWNKTEGGHQVADAAGWVDNPLTEADLAADAVLHRELSAVLPEAGWLSEETADSPSRLERRWAWIVDPIDGTREYSQGIDEFAISIGLARDGEIVLGVLYNPAREVLIAGRLGGGVLRDGEPSAPTAPRIGVDGAVLLASRTEARRGEFEPFKARMAVREVGSTAWKLGLVACGEGDAYFTRKPRNEWDVAAGILLCREAGLTVTDLGRGQHRFNRPDPLCRGVVVAAAGMHDEIMGMIEAIGTLE